MPALIIPNTFVPFTRIFSAEVNANFTAISTLLNTTKLDDDNIQNLGISLAKLKQSSATTGQVPVWNGSVWIPGSAGLSTMFNKILGSAADVSSGIASNSTFASITQADGDRILVLPGYATTENWSITKKVFIQGLGPTCVVTGTVTFTNTSDESQLLFIRITDNVTLNSGADAIHVNNIILASGKTFIDNGSGNLLEAIKE